MKWHILTTYKHYLVQIPLRLFQGINILARIQNELNLYFSRVPNTLNPNIVRMGGFDKRHGNNHCNNIKRLDRYSISQMVEGDIDYDMVQRNMNNLIYRFQYYLNKHHR